MKTAIKSLIVFSALFCFSAIFGKPIIFESEAEEQRVYPLTGEIIWGSSPYSMDLNQVITTHSGFIYYFNEACVYWNDNKDRQPLNSPCKEWSFSGHDPYNYDPYIIAGKKELSPEGFFLELSHQEIKEHNILTEKRINSRIPAFKLAASSFPYSQGTLFYGNRQNEDWICFSALYDEKGQPRPPKELSFVQLVGTRIHDPTEDLTEPVYEYKFLPEGGFYPSTNFDTYYDVESLFVYDISGRMIELQVQSPSDYVYYRIPKYFIGDGTFGHDYYSANWLEEEEQHQNNDDIKAKCIGMKMPGFYGIRMMP